ncbi:extracellular solute-binding protein [Paenibacillus aestuarii]|uniref:Extracellular solute-binding protein n=1 Tax=Paenibacillus aestuarii TaxID=516965 RepID=A0ABW0KII1_9BACL|nr:extracellular solute-binding protein [Paenibacillus aestuarii]
MKLTKGLAGLLSISLISFMAACSSAGGSGNSGNTDKPAVASGEDKSKTSNDKAVSELVFFGVDIDVDKEGKYWKSFEDENKVKIKVVTTKSDKFMETFMASHNAKQTIDILRLNGQDVRFMSTAGMIKDITDQVSPYKDRFNTAALSPFSFGGKIFGVPTGSMSTSAIFYNKKILDANGLKPPTSLQDLEALNAALKQKGLSTFAFMGKDIYMWPMWFFQTFAQASGNKSVERTMDTLRGKAKFTDADYVAAMKALQQIGKSGSYIPGVNGVDATAAKAIFSTGKAAMFYGGSWESAGFIKSAKDSGGKIDLAVAKFPLISDQAGIKAESTGGSGAALAISSTIDPNKEALAKKFLDYWTSDKLQQQMLNDNNGVFAVNVNVKSNSTDPVIDDLTKNYLKDTVTFLDWYWPPEITKAFQQNIQAVVGGQKEPEAAMQEIQKTFDDLVAKGYNFDKKE